MGPGTVMVVNAPARCQGSRRAEGWTASVAARSRASVAGWSAEPPPPVGRRRWWPRRRRPRSRRPRPRPAGSPSAKVVSWPAPRLSRVSHGRAGRALADQQHLGLQVPSSHPAVLVEVVRVNLFTPLGVLPPAGPLPGRVDPVGGQARPAAPAVICRWPAPVEDRRPSQVIGQSGPWSGCDRPAAGRCGSGSRPGRRRSWPGRR